MAEENAGSFIPILFTNINTHHTAHSKFIYLCACVHVPVNVCVIERIVRATALKRIQKWVEQKACVEKIMTQTSARGELLVESADVRCESEPSKLKA